MVERIKMSKRRSFTLPASAIPDKIIRLENPDYIAERLNQTVAAGQLWMAKTDAGAQYVLVGSVHDDARIITAIPMSNNTAMQTEGSLTVRNTPLGMAMVAWPALAAEVPVRILFKPLDEFEPDVTDALVNDRVEDALGVERVTDPEDLLPSSKKDMFTIRKCMETWHAMCAKLPKLHGNDTMEYHTDDDLAAYSEALKTVLHLTPAQRLAVSRGRQLTPEQQQKMADAGYATQPHKQETIADDYLIMAEQPQWYEAAAAIAQANARAGVQDDPRVKLAHKAQFELAARTSGHGEEAIRGAFRKAAESVIEESGR